MTEATNTYYILDVKTYVKKIDIDNYYNPNLTNIDGVEINNFFVKRVAVTHRPNWRVHECRVRRR